MVCDQCDGRLHVRVGGVWTRCACMRHVLSRAYINPLIRGADAAYHPTFDTEEPLPLTTHVSAGEFEAWRHRVWRALLAYEPTGLVYDCLDAARLVEIQFERDHVEDVDEYETGYRFLRELSLLPLLILIIQPFHPRHASFPTIFGRVVEGRRDMNRPTWIFTHLRGLDLLRVHGGHPKLAALFGDDVRGHRPTTSVRQSNPDVDTPLAPVSGDSTQYGSARSRAEKPASPVERTGA